MISIVVPIYNVEKYIYKCVDSILKSGIQDFELILVNDGSPDASISKIQEFLCYPNITLINQVNGGLSNARNTGLSVSKGEYIWFIDSDDSVNFIPGFYDRLSLLMTKNVDVIQLQYNLVYEDNSCEKEVNLHFDGSSDGIDLMRRRLIHTPAQFKIFRKSFLLENDLFFYEGIYHEDVEFTFKVMTLARNCSSINYAIYNYLQRSSGSIMSSLGIKNVKDLIKINKSLIVFKIKHMNLLNHDVESFNNRICINTNMAIRILMKLGLKKNKIYLIELLDDDVLDCFVNSSVVKYKIEYYLFYLIKKIFK